MFAIIAIATVAIAAVSALSTPAGGCPIAPELAPKTVHACTEVSALADSFMSGLGF